MTAQPGHRLHVPAGSAREGDDPLVITPASAGWEFCGLRIVELAPGASRRLDTGGDEYAVLPLCGSCVVEVDGLRFELAGRTDVFSRVTDFAYLPRDASAVITSDHGSRLALPSAPARRRLDARYSPAEDVPVEIRGAGSATRQVNNFLHPDAFETDRLTCVELLTPEGNTSSYPPHKHDRDDTQPGEAILEEIYYFELRGRNGFGLHRTYTADGDIDATVAVGHGDAFLIPRGYHGPCVALPGYDLYYLNVLAGPEEERSLAFSDDPAHAWIRGSWEGMALDPRAPLADARGPR
jgi:5-deoxy-glucuronate isomerase